MSTSQSWVRTAGAWWALLPVLAVLVTNVAFADLAGTTPSAAEILVPLLNGVLVLLVTAAAGRYARRPQARFDAMRMATSW